MRMLFLGLILLFCVSVAVRWSFVRSLKVHETATWETLGRPGALPVESARGAISTLRYLINRDYQKSTHRAVVRSAALYKLCLIIYFVYFISFIVIVLFFLKHTAPHMR
jgi:hypothetical protein